MEIKEDTDRPRSLETNRDNQMLTRFNNREQRSRIIQVAEFVFENIKKEYRKDWEQNIQIVPSEIFKKVSDTEREEEG